ncbi:MAG: ABC transporter ATP-binding protein/permease [Oscillospiraceae bacterium]|nr:ABC transporter ATP-binding protein/permease [Oscillospiraceae bacterium]
MKKAKAGKPPGAGLPAEVLALLGAQGLDVDGLILSAVGDMDNEGNYCAAWMAFDRQGFYLAFGEVSRKKRKRAPALEYRLDTLQSIPAQEIDELKLERYVTTGRLIAVQGGDDVPLARFSIGLCGKLQQLCDCFNAMRQERDMTPFLKAGQGSVCPKCGDAYPDDKKICPRCGKSSGSTVRRLFSFFGGYGWQIAVTLLFLFLATGFDVLLPKLTTQTLFDRVLYTGNMEPVAQRIASLGWLVLAILGVRALDVALKMATDWVQVALDIKRKIFAAMQKLSVEFYASKQTGQLMERVSKDTTNIYWFFMDGLPYIIVCLVQLLGAIGMMFSISWRLSLLLLGVVPILLPFVLLSDKLFRRLHHKAWAKSARLTSMVSDNINGQRVIKAFSQEKAELSRFQEMSGGLREAELRLFRYEGTMFPMLTGVIAMLSAGVLILGGLQVLDGQLKIGGLLSFVIYLNMMRTPLDFLGSVFDWWAEAKDSAQRVFEVVDAQPDVREPEHPLLPEEFRGRVELRELEFEYEPARPVIKKVSLVAEAGQMLGIVGKTGAGKTTIASLISRLYDSKVGAVLIDGIDVKDLPQSLLRKQIGLVSQDIYLFTASIADNIRYAKPDATQAEVMAAAKAAAAHEFILRLPDAYETRVGNGGQALSGGERQRVSIARAILQNPKILILDEATAAMDTATERSIQESLGKLKAGRTTIAIAHRLSTLRDADRLAVIEGGELTEFGTFKELLRERGAFYSLYQVQQQALATMGSIDDERGD